MHAQFVISFLQLLQLLLRRNKLCIDQIHLLCRYHLFHHAVRLSRCWRLSSDVVQCVLVVCLEVGVFELPCLLLSSVFAYFRGDAGYALTYT